MKNISCLFFVSTLLFFLASHAPRGSDTSLLIGQSAALPGPTQELGIEMLRLAI